MKKRGERLLSLAMASAMSLSMITGWAANSVEIVGVTVDGESVQTNEVFEVNPSNLVEVTVKIKDANEAAIEGAEATFLSALKECFATESAKPLDNTTIQFVDQQTTAVPASEPEVEPASEGSAEAYATFAFRPRMEVTGLKVPGMNTAKVGGTDVETVATFDYNVKVADKNMTITGSDSFTEGSAADVTFTIGNPPTALTDVKLGDKPLTATTHYTYANGTLTILKAYLDTLTVDADTSFDLSVAADGYRTAEVANAIEVKDYVKTDVVIPDASIGDITAGLEELKPNVPDTSVEGKLSVTMPEKVGEYDVEYSFADTTTPAGVTMENGKITLDESEAPFAKVDVVAYVGKDDKGNDIKEQKVVYLVPNPKAVGFGNVGLHVKDGKDAFAYTEGSDTETDAAFRAMVDGAGFEELVDRGTILNFALNPEADKSDMPHFAGALDYDQDGKLALAEYRIYKLMMDGNEDDTHSFSKVNAARQHWIDAAKSE